MLRFVVLTTIAAAILAPTAAASWPGWPYYVTNAQAETSLQKRYDFAFCLGIQRYGTHSITHDDNYGYRHWAQGFLRFQCSYDVGAKHCFGAIFDSLTTSSYSAPHPRWHMWKTVPGRCYTD